MRDYSQSTGPILGGRGIGLISRLVMALDVPWEREKIMNIDINKVFPTDP